MRIDVVTIFPEYLSPLDLSLVGKARSTGLLDLRVHDLRGPLEANPHAAGAQHAVADPLGLHLHDGLRHALDDRERVVHTEGDLLLLGLLDELGQAATGHVVPGHVGRLAALQAVAQPEDAGAAQQGHHTASLRQARVHARLEHLFREGPHQHVAVKIAAGDDHGPMDRAKRIAGQFGGQEVGPEAGVIAHDFSRGMVGTIARKPRFA